MKLAETYAVLPMINRPKILIVDDDTANLNILVNTLKEQGDISVTKHGKEAIRLAEKIRPDLILLDVIMPDINGFELIRLFQKNDRLVDIPVIFITALKDVDSEEKGLALGASDYISKPIRPRIVRARVNLHLKLQKQKRLLEQQAMMDSLTGLPNRRSFDLRFDQYWATAIAAKAPFSMALIDVDFFKLLNDFYGHAGGDRTLEAIGQLLFDCFANSQAFVARYGGEEFAVVFPEQSATSAKKKIANCVEVLAQENLPHLASKIADQVTFSIGGISCCPSDSVKIADIFAEADAQLYKAKENGRNQTCWQEF